MQRGRTAGAGGLIVLLGALTGGACERSVDSPAPPATSEQQGSGAGTLGWDLQSSGEGVALVLGTDDRTTVRLFCSAGQDLLLVNVPAFRPVGSEERLSVGGGGEVIALVADPRGDAQRGGVSGKGPVPENLPALVSGPVGASYGAQTSGPHPPPPAQMARAFALACAEAGGPPVPAPAPRAAPQPGQAHPCQLQNERRLPAMRLKAIGTEPFWAARIEGRCVTYMTPEDQAGTRVWTRFSGSSQQGEWSGSLDNQPFGLRTRPQPGCSDGMSDNRYPIAVTLTVRGEERTGCAEPL